MDAQAKIHAFLEEAARRDAGRAVTEREMRAAIGGYVKCLGIVYRGKRELSPGQMDKALRYYNRRRAELHRQPLLVA